jgi:hypothetical protein
VRFPQSEPAYYAYDVDKLDAWARLQPLLTDHQVYLSQLWAEHGTLRFLIRKSGVKSLGLDDFVDTVVLPPAGRGAVYAFPGERADIARRMAAYWPGQNVLQSIPDRFGRPLLAMIVLDATQAAQWPPAWQPTQTAAARFQQAPTLLGLQAAPGTSEVSIFWRADDRMRQSLTAFLQLLDADGQVVGQVDKLPGNGGYLTSQWAPGDRVIERYRPQIDPCAGGAPAQVMVGWYDLAQNAARIPRADRYGNSALAGVVTLPALSVPAAEMEPAQRRERSLTTSLTLMGYTLHGGPWQAGAPLTLDLYWRGDPSAATQAVTLTLRSASRGDDTLWSDAAAPAEVHWRPGEVVCRRVRLRLPTDAPVGAYQLQVSAREQEITLQSLHLDLSTHRFDVPALTMPINATLGDQVRLLGLDRATWTDASQPISLTLAWQAITTIPSSFTVFVHLLDSAGRPVSQSDRIPAGDHPTSAWVPGEVVLDTHILLPPTGASGPYRLVAGLYDPVSWQRLPALDASRQLIPDNAIPLGQVPLP